MDLRFRKMAFVATLLVSGAADSSWVPQDGPDPSESVTSSPPPAPRRDQWHGFLRALRKPQNLPLPILLRMSNAGNGALLLMSAPIQWVSAGVGSLAALRALIVSAWLSAAGGLLLAREIRVPSVRLWLRQHVRFAATPSGRHTLHLFAATLSLVSGSYVGVAIGAVTLLNMYFVRKPDLARAPCPRSSLNRQEKSYRLLRGPRSTLALYRGGKCVSGCA